jgi:D-glycero-alpha-D-manno-heptose-7-phosphate kinase
VKILKTSPTRVDLSGGTLDCWPLYLMVGDCVTVNLSISVSTQAELEERADSAIAISLKDLNYKKTFKNYAEFSESEDRELALVKRHIEYWKPKKGFSLETSSQSPVGGGLGGSSSLSISLIKAFTAWLDVKLNVTETVELAHNLEAQVLKKPTGTQDYFPALQPGLNAIHYTPSGPKLEKLPTEAALWNQHLSLVYTGQPHHSGLNNWQVIKAVLDGDTGPLRALSEIKDISWDLYRAVKSQDWKAFPGLFDREFEARVRLSSSFSSPEIDRLRDVALKAGALAVKICGAGGGGCVLVWSQPDKKKGVEAGCRAQGFEVLNVEAVL